MCVTHGNTAGKLLNPGGFIKHGEVKSYEDENIEVLFMDCDELLQRGDATDTVKMLVKQALSRKPIVCENVGKGIMFTSSEPVLN